MNLKSFMCPTLSAHARELDRNAENRDNSQTLTGRDNPPPEDDGDPKLGWWGSSCPVLVPAEIIYAPAVTVMGD